MTACLTQIKNIKEVKGLIIDEFGENAGIMYDIASPFVGGRSIWMM
jgi:hypothetical protein